MESKSMHEKAAFLRDLLSELDDTCLEACYDALVRGDLLEVARLIGDSAMQAVIEHAADQALGGESGPFVALDELMRGVEKRLDDRDRARDMNKTLKGDIS